MVRTTIALVTTELRVGGAERCLTQLAIGLDPDHYAVEVYSLAPAPAAERGELVETLRLKGIPVHFLGVDSAWQLRTAVNGLRERLRIQKPSLIQSFLFHANVVATLAARDRPELRVVHGVRVADPRAWRRWVERFATRRADAVICVSHSVAQFAAERCGVPETRIVVIPNGVDCGAIDSEPAARLADLGIPEGRRAICSVGRLDRQKGFDWLLECASEFLAELPDHDLVIVGGGPERDSLRTLTRKLGIAGRVHMPGWRSDVIGILKASDAFVLSSRWEGMPNALLEAMACSLPVVATQVEGVAEVVRDFADRQLVSPTDSRGFVQRVVKCLRDPALAEELAAANRWRVQQEFAVEQMVSLYDKVYRGLAGS